MLKLSSIITSIILVLTGPFQSGCQTADASNKVNLDNGYRALDARDYDQALVNAESYLRGDPAGKGVAEALYLKGRALEGRAAATSSEGSANFAAARDAYQQSLAAVPNKQLMGLVHSGLGNTNYWLEDFDAAARNWAQAFDEMEDESAKAFILYRVGLCMQRMGDFAGADQRFSSVQQQYTGSDAANRAREKQGFKEFNVQVATFASAPTANGTIAQLQKDGLTVRKGADSRGMIIVSVGPYPNYAQASATRTRIAMKYPSAIIVP